MIIVLLKIVCAIVLAYAAAWAIKQLNKYATNH